MVQSVITVDFPDDMVGIGIYSLSTILFGIVALGFFINWRKEKN